MTNQTHTVQIPEAYLLTLAVHGNMGDGELPFFIQNWAESQCERLGLQEKMMAEKAERYEAIKKRAKAILGSSTVDMLERVVETTAPTLTRAVNEARKTL